jgi:hypothetical protein
MGDNKEKQNMAIQQGQKYERFSHSEEPSSRGQWYHEIRVIVDVTDSHVLYELEKEDHEGTIVETDTERQQATMQQWCKWAELARLVNPANQR